MTADAILLAAGKGLRMQADKNKVLLPIDGVSILRRTVKTFAESGLFERIVVVGAAEELPQLAAECEPYAVLLAAGGELRRDSVLCGLAHCTAELVAIHDAARPFVTQKVIADSLQSAAEKGSGVAGVPLKDTVKVVSPGGVITHTPPRKSLVSVQTPQSFRRALISRAYAAVPDRDVTDDASVLERYGGTVYITPGDPMNIKITTAEDLLIGQVFAREG